MERISILKREGVSADSTKGRRALGVRATAAGILIRCMYFNGFKDRALVVARKLGITASHGFGGVREKFIFSEEGAAHLQFQDTKAIIV